jgi:hypothetical protein
VAKTNTPFNVDYGFEQAVNAIVSDLHAEYIQYPEEGLFTYGVNVIAGGYKLQGSDVIGQVHFHVYDEDPKQFITKDVYEVDNTLTHLSEVNSTISFVYYNSFYTAEGIPPKEPVIGEGIINLFVNNTEEEVNIGKINLVQGIGTNITYRDSGTVEIVSDHIESDTVKELESHTVSIEFKNEFEAVPSGIGNLRVYRIIPEEDYFIMEDVLFGFPSTDWLTTTGFTIVINSLENLTGIEVDYTFIKTINTTRTSWVD